MKKGERRNDVLVEGRWLNRNNHLTLNSRVMMNSRLMMNSRRRKPAVFRVPTP